MARPVAWIAVLLVAVACGSTTPVASSSAAPTASPQPCHALSVGKQQLTLAASDQPTSGFALPAGTKPVGLARDQDGVSVWLLGTGTNTVMHVAADGGATAYAFPDSGLGLQLSVAADGTVWIPEQSRDAIASIAPDGTVRECALPGKGRQPVATAAAADGSVWVTEAAGAAVAHLENGRFTEYPIGVAGARGAEVLAADDGGAWFTVMGAPVLGHVSAAGQVEQVPIGGSGSCVGLLETPDKAIFVADFGGDRVVRVAPDRSLATWPAPAGSRPRSLALGPAGTPWVTLSGADEIAPVRGGGADQTYKTGAGPDHIAITTDGWAWFTEDGQSRLGRILLPPT